MQITDLAAVKPSRDGFSRYLDRKARELALIENTLHETPPPLNTTNLPTIFKRKFKSAALCRAEMAAHQWSRTETSWSSGPCGSGAFQFDYDYQRADLKVEGPPVYAVGGLEGLMPTLYTASGMAAISASLLAVRRLWPRCSFDIRADGYPETRELIALLDQEHPEQSTRIAVIDSTVDTPLSARRRLHGATAAIFDTSCFAASSGRIRTIVELARARDIPMVLVRSHTKLDCFGLDYGRLGSIVAVTAMTYSPVPALHTLMADFIRLNGSAALPMHFPPFAGSKAFRELSRARTAWTIRCTRLIEHRLRSTGVPLRSFGHGLYLVLYPCPFSGKDDACVAATDIVARLIAAGVPARQAGSFGFDFFGCDWFEDPQTHEVGIRLSIGDLPNNFVECAINVICAWLSEKRI